MAMSLLLVSARRRDVASVAGLWFTDRLFLFFFIPELISAITYPIAEIFLSTNVSLLRVVKNEFYFFTCFSLGDLTFSIAAQKRFVLGEIRKQMCHLR